MSDSPTRLVQASLGASCVGVAVEFSALLPADHSAGEPLPLILHLHEAFASSAALERVRPLYDELWLSGRLPRAMIACASTRTRGGFYIDRPGANWETLIAVEFPAYLRTHYAPGTAEALIGVSMGGYAALKLVCSAPGSYIAAAAIAPAVFAGEAPGDVVEGDLPAALADLHAAMAGGTGDAETYLHNSVQGRARVNVEELRGARPQILIDCSSVDEAVAAEGAIHLHRVLSGLEVEHEFRLVPGPGHPDTSLEGRTREAIGFIGAALLEARGQRPGATI
jgi:S-formylglutathione hydrolase